MKGSGATINGTEEGMRGSRTVTYTKGNSYKEKPMGRVFSLGLMEKSMTGSG